jgi:steroid 5-alpha reductase family enzyme
MSLLELLGANLVLTLALMAALWVVSLALRDVSIVDVFWGIGFVVIAGATFLQTGPATPRKLLLFGLTTLWGLRLAVYLGRRKFGTPEDHRYQSLRARIGPRFWLISLVLVFGLQGVVMNVVALPIVLGQLDAASLGGLDAVGVLLWGIGFVFESVGDWQLARFKAQARGEGDVLDRGLWRYTRHPNYFGDFMVWWGLYVVSLGSGGAWWTIVSPLLMSYLLLRVSGVTMLEDSLRARKPAYADYVARTSAFFPWPPRASAPELRDAAATGTTPRRA